MSNLDLATRFNDAAARRDVPVLEALISPDAVWDMSRSRGPYSGVYTGQEEIRQLLEGVIDAWDRMEFERVSTYEVGNRLAEEVKGLMRGRGSGVELVARGARVYEFEDGQIKRFVMFQTMNDAREFVDAQAG